MNTSLVSSSSGSIFNFNATHNGIQCIQSLKPEDQGTERQFYFPVKYLSYAFDVSDKTIRNKIEKLESLGEISNCNFLQLLLPDNSKPSTLYDLTVLNKLAMTLDCECAVDVRKAFNDVLIKEETKQETRPAISREDQFLLSVIHAESKEETVLALRDYKNYRDEQQREIEQERDEAIRTKAFISSKREATAMATAKQEKAKRIALEERIGEGTKWMSSAQLIKNYNIMGANGKIMNPRTLTIALKKHNCKWRKSDVPDSNGYLYTIFWVADVVETLKLD